MPAALDWVRLDANTVLFITAFADVEAIRLPEHAQSPLTTLDAPWCEPCEGCGDPAGTAPGNGIARGGDEGTAGPCGLCLGTGRALFAFNDTPGPLRAVCVPGPIAAAWLDCKRSAAS